MKRILFASTLFLLCMLSLGATSPLPTWAQASAEGRNLPDIELFVTQPNAQWAGSGDGLLLEGTDVAYLPLEQAEDGNDRLAYRVSVSRTGEFGWWSFILASRDWEPYSITPYLPNGTLQFKVKGASGGERFKIVLNDIEDGREPLHISSAEIDISERVTLSTEWQTVEIRLADFGINQTRFNADQMFTIGFSNVDNQEMTFWLSDIRFRSADIEPYSNDMIKVNQLGYRPQARKTALVSTYPDVMPARAGDRFGIYPLDGNDSGLPLYEGELQLVTDLDPIVSGETVLAADFTDLSRPGRYELRLPAYEMPASVPFEIGESIYEPLLVESARYFYLQRSGLPLDATFAGQFARGIGHPQDQIATFRSDPNRIQDVSGGWYDAGDYGKYTNAGATAVSDMLWAFELFADHFPDNAFNIPESGNRVPDLLDEARWELDWILKMQDPRSGGFYHMVQPTTDVLIDQANAARFIEDREGDRVDIRPTSSSGSAVAILAHGAYLFAEIDAAYAAELLAAAEFGWRYLEANPDLVPPMEGPYSDKEDIDNRFWAAAALYRATGDPRYAGYIEAVYQSVPTPFTSETDNAYGVNDMSMIAWVTIAHTDLLEGPVGAYFEAIFLQWYDHMVDRWESSVWQLTLLDEDFYWGSNYVVLTTPIVMLIGADALELERQTGLEIMQTGLDYLLGTNPLGFGYISGFGERSMENPHSKQWSIDQIEAVPAGILAGGPNAYTNQLLYSNFVGKRYIDGSGYWSLNEHTIYWNSALLFGAAAMMDLDVSQRSSASPSSTVTLEPTTPPTEIPPTAAADAAGPEPTSMPTESATETPEPQPTEPAETAAPDSERSLTEIEDQTEGEIEPAEIAEVPAAEESAPERSNDEPRDELAVDQQGRWWESALPNLASLWILVLTIIIVFLWGWRLRGRDQSDR